MKSAMKSAQKKITVPELSDSVSNLLSPTTMNRPSLGHVHNSSIAHTLNLPEEFKTNLNGLTETPLSERPNLLLKKIKLCTHVFDFRNENPLESDAKELKRQTLLELIDHVQQTKHSFSEPLFAPVFQMIASNLFRALPPTPFRSGLDPPDEDEPMQDDAWPHLSLVYEFLSQFLLVFVDLDIKTLKKFINPAFVVSLLELFDSEDARERECLKAILHRVYGKFMSLRTHIRSAINHIFFRFVYETQSHNGIAELLEILGSIINGFALPLKEEHKNFLTLVLTPLHKSTTFGGYCAQLSYCVSQFVEKDSTLSVPVVTQILKYWPVQNSHKEVLFLSEIEELLEFTPPDMFQHFMIPLFKQIAESLRSLHFQVAERALYLWNNEYVSTLIFDFRDVLLPIVFGSLYRNIGDTTSSRNENPHWSSTVGKLSANVMQLYIDSDYALYEKCLAQHNSSVLEKTNSSRINKSRWAVLEKRGRFYKDF